MIAKQVEPSATGSRGKFTACLWLRTWSDVNTSSPMPLARELLGSCKSHFKLRLSSFQGQRHPRVWGTCFEHISPKCFAGRDTIEHH